MAIRPSYTRGFVLIRQRANRKSLRCQKQLFMTTDARANIAIVGGGLAGLSTAFHLLDRQHNLKSECNRTIQSITVFDTHPVGMGGASAVAGGLLHPLTPRGKVAFLGWEGLEATNRLVDRTLARKTGKPQQIVLREEIFRIATSQDYATKFQGTAEKHAPLGCFEWIPPLDQTISSSNVDPIHPLGKYGSEAIQNNKFGVLRLFGRCGRVIHVPSYLQALWDECRAMNTPCSWKLVDPDTNLGLNPDDLRLDGYDTVVYCAGAGLFRNSMNDDGQTQVRMLGAANARTKKGGWGVQLVRGQSMELKARQPLKEGEKAVPLLFGKYICPTLPSKSMDDIQQDAGDDRLGNDSKSRLETECLLVGATHEFGEDPWSPEAVARDLWGRVREVTPYINERTHEASAFTSGFRVQTQRGSNGRVPMLGRLDDLKNADAQQHTPWVFTGLSSRGLLYHGLFGELLAEAVLQNNEKIIFDAHPELRWWKPK